MDFQVRLSTDKSVHAYKDYYFDDKENAIAFAKAFLKSRNVNFSEVYQHECGRGYTNLVYEWCYAPFFSDKLWYTSLVGNTLESNHDAEVPDSQAAERRRRKGGSGVDEGSQ